MSHLVFRIASTAAAIFAVTSCTPAAQPKKKPASKISNTERLKLLKTFAGEFVEITPGKGRFPKTFAMGSKSGEATERPVRTVTMSREFAIAKYEVPQNLYEAVMGTNPSRWKGPRNSAEMMSWQEAVVFCQRATALMQAAKLIAGDEVIRLPGEAEWEYCCRAGTTTAYSFGDAARNPGDAGNKATALDPYAWHTGNAAGNDPAVGVLKPNPWGLYDMHGYLWEFTSDAWHADYAKAPKDASSWDDGKKQFVLRVVRGGSWRDRYDRLRCAARMPLPDHAKSDAIGFRCVKAKTGK
jgi:formylglycine-generating enzyme required for sulfatase activity